MEKIIDEKQCCGCHVCYNICPKNAIEMVEDEKGFKHPIVDKEKCINCGLCKKVCPVLNSKKEIKEIKAYAGYNKNEEERKNSSSGGIFILLAKEIIKRKGIVYGAHLNKDNKVEHTKAEALDELEELMGSKYVQSTIGNVYKEVKKELENDRYVLFTGTPCQIEGLKSYLIKDYDKLYTQDIICHGVPSPLVWEKYKEYRKTIDKEDKPEKISFRNKDNGWELFNMKFTYKNKEYKLDQTKDLFMNAFLSDTILRSSCYQCSFKKKYRISDITLADYWQVKEVHPELNDNKGISLIIVNSSKGEELIKCISKSIELKETNLEEAIKYNPAMIMSPKEDPKREKFFNNIDKLSFDKLVKKYTIKQPLHIRIINKLKKILKAIIVRIPFLHKSFIKYKQKKKKINI